MCRAYLALFIALSLVLLQAPVGRAQAPEPAADQALKQAQPGQPSQPQTSPADNARPTPSPTDKQVEKIKRTVQKLRVGSSITVFLKNGDELHGALTQIDAESFQIAEVDLHQVFTLQYKYVKKVRSGYSGINPFTGKRTSHPKGLKIGVAIGAFFLALGLPLILLASAKD